MIFQLYLEHLTERKKGKEEILFFSNQVPQITKVHFDEWFERHSISLNYNEFSPLRFKLISLL